MIAFVVSNFRYNSTGAGGHYYTTFSIFQEVKKHRKAIMLVIGDRPPSAIDFSVDGTFFIPVTRRCGKADFDKVKSFVKQMNVCILHAFDIYAYLFSRLTGLSLNIRTILTKCGGPKPDFWYYPGFRPDTVFSIEDLEYFSKRARLFKMPPPILLPNRVGANLNFKPVPGELTLPDIGESRSIKIIRIARISKAYELSFLQTIALADKLRENGLDVTLYIIGYIQDTTVFEKIKNKIDPSDYLLTEENYTRNAARHLEGADMVVASGRGVMEASLSKKIIAVSAKDAKYPYLLDESSFLYFFRHNFSSRASMPNIPEEKNILNIIQIVSSSKKKSSYHGAMNRIHDEYFSISSALDRYFRLYDNKNETRPYFLNAIDTCIHWLYSISRLAIRKYRDILFGAN